LGNATKTPRKRERRMDDKILPALLIETGDWRLRCLIETQPDEKAEIGRECGDLTKQWQKYTFPKQPEMPISSRPGITVGQFGPIDVNPAEC
jgi:hypothetical protein